jgi:adenosylcobinamide kinase/adenosylcobinamide-phosphate guanylyltransferase
MELEKKIFFVTGGSRSGKSGFAQKLAESWQGRLLYVATAESRDEEMEKRISKHREARGERWETFETPLDLVLAVDRAKDYGGALIDCLTLWTSNLMEKFGEDEASICAEADRFVAALKASRSRIVVVTGEVGLGIVPADPYTRRFRDLAGIINQKVCAAADGAWLIVAGRGLPLE